MDSNHRSPVKDQLVETVLFDFQRRLGSAPSAVGDLNRAIWAAISAGTITSATTTTASAGDGGGPSEAYIRGEIDAADLVTAYRERGAKP
jgi:hypothetical protein